MTDEQRGAMLYQLSLRDYVIQQELIKGNLHQIDIKNYANRLKKVKSQEDMNKIEQDMDKTMRQFCYLYQEKDKDGLLIYMNNISLMLRYTDFNITKEQFIEYVKEFEGINKVMLDQAEKAQQKE